MENEIIIKELKPEDVIDENGYVQWLNDPEINRFLESRHDTHTLESTRKYVEDILNSEDNILFGIFCGNEHVGNIKIGSIHKLYRRADVGLMIAKEHWRKGIATAAIALVEYYAFTKLNIHKLFAGAYSSNKGSIKAFLRNGWEVAGEYKDHCIDTDGNYVNCCMLEKINPVDRR